MRTFQQDLGIHIVKYCNERAKKIREKIDERNEKHNTRYRGDYIVYHNSFIASKSINEVV